MIHWIKTEGFMYGDKQMIIYVEDNPNNQRLMQRMLRKRGLTAHLCETAGEGFAAIKEHQPDLIFTDMHLRGRASGLELVRWVRGAGITTPIIAVTVFGMMTDREEALEAGCDDYLLKPYHISQLLDIVDRYLGASVSASLR